MPNVIMIKYAVCMHEDVTVKLNVLYNPHTLIKAKRVITM